VQFVLHPLLQEVGDMGSDTGIADTADDLKNLLPELFAKDDLKFDIAKVDAGLVTKGWNVKVRKTSGDFDSRGRLLTNTHCAGPRLLRLSKTSHFQTRSRFPELAVPAS
jgi:hypothetical protein